LAGCFQERATLPQTKQDDHRIKKVEHKAAPQGEGVEENRGAAGLCAV
jgi:hypothetical protein